MLIDVQTGACDLAPGQHIGQSRLVDHFTAGRIDQDGMGLKQLHAPGGQEVEGCGRVGAVDRHHIHAGQHLVEALPIGGLQLFFDAWADGFAVVIMDLQTKGLGALGHGLTDPAHTDNAQALAIDPATHHPGRRPALKAAALNHLSALNDAAGGGQNKGHGHIGGVFGQNAGRIGHGNAARIGGGDIDIIDPGPEIGDQLERGSGARQKTRINPIGNGRDQHLGALKRVKELVLPHRLVGQVQLGVEQFTHTGLHRIGEFACNNDFRLADGHEAI